MKIPATTKRDIDLEEVVIPAGTRVTLIAEGINGWPAVIYDGEEYDVAIDADELVQIIYKVHKLSETGGHHHVGTNHHRSMDWNEHRGPLPR